ncbi:MAG: polyprenyl synthetase [Flavobacteriaceae bacterium]|nr:polyprenyl synthetase [Flavobacteriaceae bacterium]|tara:strand:- start:20580 stop:21560 length:981 start_codon:yes stop_codon:yes gene_type:complete
MKITEEIKAPIYKEMEMFEKKIFESISSKVVLLNRITKFIVDRKGKQIRPMFVFLIAKLFSKNQIVNERTYRGATIIELIHTATLVHDDVVDNSTQRRGFFSINALWKNKIAVLVGDYLLSKGLLLSIENEDFDLLKIISVAVSKMSQGELLQIEKSRIMDIDEDIYFKIIRQKTASLLAACCSMGAKSVHATVDEVKKTYKFGELIGMAFQIKDDLFDYTEAKIGKPTGADIKEKKITLPLIYAINVADKKDKEWIINVIKNNTGNKKIVRQLVNKVIDLGGLEYASNLMNNYKDNALAQLNDFPKNKFRHSLELMVNYVVERNI